MSVVKPRGLVGDFMLRAVFENEGTKEFIASRGGVISIAIRDYIVG